MFSHFRILRNRNYALYFAGQMVSMSGTWMQSVAQAWLVYRLTHSATWLGLATFCTQVPAFLMSVIAGVVADRLDRRKILIVTEVLAMVQATILAVLVLTDSIQVWHVMALSVVLGVVNAFDLTTRHAFAIQMVGRGELSSAITLNTVLINASRVVGPALAGFAISFIGEGGCFVANAVSYLAVLAGLIAMKISPPPPPAVQEPDESRFMRTVHAFGDAIRYVHGQREIRVLLLFATYTGFASVAYYVLMPVLARSLSPTNEGLMLGSTHQGGSLVGWMTAISGLGAVIGVLRSGVTARLENVRRVVLMRILRMGVTLFLLALLKDTVWGTYVALFFVGYCTMAIYPAVNNAIQHTVDERFRGRVMSLYSMTYLGAAPIGGLVSGALTDRWGAGTTLWAFGVLTVLFGSAGIYYWAESGAASSKAFKEA